MPPSINSVARRGISVRRGKSPARRGRRTWRRPDATAAVTASARSSTSVAGSSWRNRRKLAAVGPNDVTESAMSVGVIRPVCTTVTAMGRPLRSARSPAPRCVRAAFDAE